MSTILLAPSLLASDFSHLADQIAQVEEGEADWLHLDVMDGHFVPNISFGPLVIQAVRKCTKLPLDTHLMIENPDDYLEAFRDAGSDHIIVHQETCTHLHRTVSQIKELGAKAGVAINPATSVSTLSDVLPDIDLILIMSVNPGFGGQKFIRGSLKKIREVSSMIKESGREIFLEVDGGIDPATAPHVVEAGANVLVAGTAVFSPQGITQAITKLRQSYITKQEKL